jgi:branched-chain amino acid transport system ATP-binding protein
MKPLLEARAIEGGYGKVQVLWGASLAVAPGQSVVLLGANGAGKTTLIRSIMGLLTVWRGSVEFAGQDISALRTDRRVRAGLSYMSEIGCFPGMSIDENIRIGGQFLERAALERRVDQLYSSFPAIAQRRRELASALSGGQRKMLGIAKALAGNPQLLIMDEPSAGLSPLLVKEVIALLRRFRGDGLSLLIAEQNVKFLELADQVYTMQGGRIEFSGTVEQLHADDALRRAYFGLSRKERA